MGEMSEVGRLILLGAPLGNPADASARLREVLATADVVAAEDTRRLTRLARDLDLTVGGRIVSYFEGNEERRTPELVEAILGGYVVALVTDGGMPSVSDPGYRLVRAALDVGAPVTVAPGPERGHHRAGRLRAALRPVLLRGLPAPHRPAAGDPGCARSPPRSAPWSSSRRRTGSRATLTDLADTFGADRPAALCRELTKTYEEVLRRPLGELARWAAEGDPRGEITLVVAGAPVTAAERPDDDTLRAAVAEREAAGRSRRDAITDVATEYALRRRDVYTIVHS